MWHLVHLAQRDHGVPRRSWDSWADLPGASLSDQGGEVGWGVHRGADDGSVVQIQVSQVELHDRASNRASDHLCHGDGEVAGRATGDAFACGHDVPCDVATLDARERDRSSPAGKGVRDAR